MASKGKGKGPGSVKGGPPPPPPKSGGGPPKGKASGGFAPNMKPHDGKISAIFFLLQGAKVQLGDGTFAPQSVYDSIKQFYTTNQDTTLGRLLKEDTLFCTAAYVETFDMLARSDYFQKEREVTHVTKMGNGRGIQDETETELVKRSVKDAVVMFASHSILGDRCIDEARAWVAANTGDGKQEANARAWVADVVHIAEFTPKATKAISEEDREKREALRREKSKAEEENRQRCLAHWQSLAMAPITNVPWAKCQKTMHVEGGSGGCLLVELEGGQAICLKPQRMHAVAEFLAERVFRALDVRVASCRVLQWTEDEFHDLTRSLLHAPVMIEGQEVKVRRVLTGHTGTSAGGIELAVEYVGVLEFLPGHGLIGMDAHNALAGEMAAQIYKGLGRICAVDAVINNLDRVPLPLWSNDGNLSNVMVSGGEAVAIDQQVNTIVEGPGRQAYLAKLRVLVEDSRAGASSKAAASVKQALLENTGTDVPDMALELVIGELRRGFERCAELWRSGMLARSINDMEAEAMARFDLATTDVGQTRVEAMADFVRCTAAEVAAAVSDATA
mmetsp:Transcript_41234/g.113728  ORF Transcript_41234/g.113728 Transcript_41234/m.113728 type:complete len:560 (-) Transcript_41234:186-1865(-)|eukprot:CAMPEP_0117505270 /NCGR_PEP_ID=MMETSP0784-20121206/25290_1 /TAXON_ID=39447 /ORGANISM="" /LENGTH=559 /DNA_ID=CAMNT_0005300675 /DNA_START=78 /DNA_END=1757 /DNA_ORIENTATION=-